MGWTKLMFAFKASKFNEEPERKYSGWPFSQQFLEGGQGWSFSEEESQCPEWCVSCWGKTTEWSEWEWLLYAWEEGPEWDNSLVVQKSWHKNERLRKTTSIATKGKRHPFLLKVTLNWFKKSWCIVFKTWKTLLRSKNPLRDCSLYLEISTKFLEIVDRFQN